MRPPPFQGRVIFPSVDRRCCLSPFSVAGPRFRLISPHHHLSTRTSRALRGGAGAGNVGVSRGNSRRALTARSSSGAPTSAGARRGGVGGARRGAGSAAPSGQAVSSSEADPRLLAPRSEQDPREDASCVWKPRGFSSGYGGADSAIRSPSRHPLMDKTKGPVRAPHRWRGRETPAHVHTRPAGVTATHASGHARGPRSSPGARSRSQLSRIAVAPAFRWLCLWGLSPRWVRRGRRVHAAVMAKLTAALMENA